MVVGASHSGKFSFIKFLFKNCFNRHFYIDDEEKEFRSFQHTIPNGRRNARQITVVHNKGFKENNSKTWYKGVKK
jgi:hypothetical protein